MTTFIQYTIFGVILGAGFAIAATGLVVTYATSGVFNFAQGAVGMIEAFSYWELVANHHVPVVVALVIILLVGAPLAGAMVERVLMRRLDGATAERPIMVTLGLLVILTGLATIVWSPKSQYQLNPIVPGSFRLADINFQFQQVLTIGIAMALVIGLHVLLSSTRTGMALRAVVDDPRLLAMAGASPTTMSQYGWMLGFVMAALAGVLLALTQQQTGINIVAMTLLVVNGYAAAIVGRLKNLGVTFGAAIVIGLLEDYIIFYALPHLPQGLDSDISLALPMVFLFIALVMLPSVRLRAVGRLSGSRVPRLPSRKTSAVSAVAFLGLVWVASVVLHGDVVRGTNMLNVGGEVMAFGIVGLSLVLLTGYSGQVSLCQFSFMGIGAFLMGKVSGGGSLLGLLVAAGVCGMLGALVALPTIRLRALYFGLATFAFADAVDQGLFQDPRFFGAGITVGRIVLPGLSFGGNQSEFLLVSVLFILAALMVLAIRRGVFGRRLVAMHDSPAAYATVGLNLARTKVAVFAIAAAMAGFAGGLYATVNGTVGTTDFELFSGIIFILFVTIWSIRTVTGAFLAAVTYVGLTTFWSTGVGLVAGAGIILIGRAASGMLGIDRLTTVCRLPWTHGSVKEVLGEMLVDNQMPAVAAGKARPAFVATPAVEARAAGATGATGAAVDGSALTVAKVSVRFGGVTALVDVDVVVWPGTVTGLIGPNGAGKTTLFNVISGLQQPDQGTVCFFDTDVTMMPPHRRTRLGLARTFQRLELFGTLTAGENVQVGLESAVKWWQWQHVHRTRLRRKAPLSSGGKPENTGAMSVAPVQVPTTAEGLLAEVGLPNASHQPVNAMPTGWARQVELARGLAIGPKLVLLDEPGSGLDEVESHALGTLLVRLAAGGMAVLLVEHDMDLVMTICDQIHVLDFGQVIASGSPEEIRANPVVHAAYLGANFRVDPVSAGGNQ